jgi:hypothetical protein
MSHIPVPKTRGIVLRPEAKVMVMVNAKIEAIA